MLDNANKFILVAKMYQKMGVDSYAMAQNISKISKLRVLKRKRQVICWIENHIKKIDNYIEN